MVKVGFDPFDVRVIFPLTALVLVGLNETVKVALWPPVRVKGAVMPLMLNPDPPAIVT
jgi:hypothetical protein